MIYTRPKHHFRLPDVHKLSMALDKFGDQAYYNDLHWAWETFSRDQNCEWLTVDSRTNEELRDILLRYLVPSSD